MTKTALASSGIERCHDCNAPIAERSDACTCMERRCESCWWARQRALGAAACRLALTHFAAYPNSRAGLPEGTEP